MDAVWRQLELPLPVVYDADAGGAPRFGARSDPRSRSDAELLTTIVGVGHGAVCARLRDVYGDLRRLAAIHPADLRDHGLPAGAIDRFLAAFEIARRYGEVEWSTGEPFKGSYDVYAHFRERLAAETVEHFIAVLLDNKHRKIRDVTLSIGSLTASIVHPRDVFSRVIREAVAAIVLVHNHPSGDPTPSAEDLEITRRLRGVAELIGVRILDHVIIGKGRFVSFVDDGYW
jgi:DNA repair protein RadC